MRVLYIWKVNNRNLMTRTGTPGGRGGRRGSSRRLGKKRQSRVTKGCTSSVMKWWVVRQFTLKSFYVGKLYVVIQFSGKDFNEKFCCVYGFMTKLVWVTSACTSNGCRSCSFRCGCNNAASTLRFRHYSGAVERVNGKNQFIFQVNFEKQASEESLVHFAPVKSNELIMLI
jgi:hypothetical protein